MNTLRLIFAGLIFSAITGPPLYSQEITESLDFKLDGRAWIMIEGPLASNISQHYYVLENETLETATERITVQAFNGLQEQFTSKEFVEEALEIMGVQLGPGFEWKYLEEDEKDLLYEFTIKDHPELPTGYSVQRVIAGKQAIHVIMYGMRDPSPPEAERSKWRGILAQVKLVQKEVVN